MSGELDYYDDKTTDKENSGVEWTSTPYSIGEHTFRVNGGKEHNLFADFPHNLTPEEVAVFRREESYWADYFAGRLAEYDKERGGEI